MQRSRSPNLFPFGIAAVALAATAIALHRRWAVVGFPGPPAVPSELAQSAVQVPEWVKRISTPGGERMEAK